MRVVDHLVDDPLEVGVVAPDDPDEDVARAGDGMCLEHLGDRAEVVDDGGVWRVMSAPSLAYDIKDALEAAGFEIESVDTPMVSDNLVPVTNVEDAKKILRIMEAIEDNDDVQDVYSNFDIADDVMEAAAG